MGLISKLILGAQLLHNAESLLPVFSLGDGEGRLYEGGSLEKFLLEDLALGLVEGGLRD
jgi:hypothetical protein